MRIISKIALLHLASAGWNSGNGSTATPWPPVSKRCRDWLIGHRATIKRWSTSGFRHDWATVFHAFAALSRNITELTAVLGRSHRKRRAEGCGVRRNDMVDTLCCRRDTHFVGQDADDLTSWHVR